MAHYYLSPFIGTGTWEDKYRPPVDGPRGIIDLRADSTDPAGWCMLWTPDEVANATQLGLRDLGDDTTAPLPVPVQNSIESRLSLSLTATNLGGILGELLINHARIDGTRWKPLRFQRRRRPDPDDGKLTARYRGIYFGAPGVRIWEQLVRDGPGTTISEDFDKGDNGLGPDLTWADVVQTWAVLSNQAVRGATGAAYTRAEHNLASDDQYAQLEDHGPATGTIYSGPTCRFDPAATTCYIGSNRQAGTDFSMDKIIDGSTTNISTQSGEARTIGAIVRLEVSASDLVGKYNGTTYATDTDTDITDHLRAGMFSFNGTIYDNFEAGDLAAPAAGLPPPYQQQVYHQDSSFREDQVFA